MDQSNQRSLPRGSEGSWNWNFKKLQDFDQMIVGLRIQVEKNTKEDLRPEKGTNVVRKGSVPGPCTVVPTCVLLIQAALGSWPTGFPFYGAKLEEP